MVLLIALDAVTEDAVKECQSAVKVDVPVAASAVATVSPLYPPKNTVSSAYFGTFFLPVRAVRIAPTGTQRTKTTIS